jgi:hypothetical protein
MTRDGPDQNMGRLRIPTKSQMRNREDLLIANQTQCHNLTIHPHSIRRVQVAHIQVFTVFKQTAMNSGYSY